MRTRIPSPRRLADRYQERRRGNIVVLSAAMMVMIFAFTAFSVDVGYIALTRTQMQAGTDAATLAAGLEQYDSWNPGATRTVPEAETAGRDAAVAVAAEHHNGNVDTSYMDRQRDIRFGQREWDPTTGTYVETWGIGPYNLVETDLRRDQASSANNDLPLPLFFAKVIGIDETDVYVSSAAAMMPATGFNVGAPGSKDVAKIMPFTVDKPTWEDLRAGLIGEDNFAWDGQQVSAGQDGVLELNIYPNNNDTEIAGNRGTLDFGSGSNKNSEIMRQILYGLNAYDLEPYGGEIDFGTHGPYYLSGDTGVSAGFENDMRSIIGEKRAIPLYTEVMRPGENATYKCVEFAGARIMDIRLTGANKGIWVQPAVVIDDSAVEAKISLGDATIFTPFKLIR